MSGARASLAAPETILEHVSAHGPTVTHVRGTLIASSRDNLRELGVYDEYVQRLPSNMRDALLYALASSWLPIEVALAHYHTCEQLGLTPVQIARMGELSAARIVDTFAGLALKIAQGVGAESYWKLLAQNDRLYDRMYQGGGVTVLKTGPKDVWLENHGQPLATCRFWRAAYLAYMEGVARAFSRVAYVKPARPRVASPHSIAVSGSWV